MLRILTFQMPIYKPNTNNTNNTNTNTNTNT
jgi:hypothetical protein